MKKYKIIYYIATGFMTLVFTFSASMYIFAYERASGFFVNLGFPTWLIYPLAALKILGLIAVLTKKSAFLKELAYAGFLFDALLALSAHLIVADGEFMPAVIAIVGTITSWIYDRKIWGNYKQILQSNE